MRPLHAPQKERSLTRSNPKRISRASKMGAVPKDNVVVARSLLTGLLVSRALHHYEELLAEQSRRLKVLILCFANVSSMLLNAQGRVNVDSAPQGSWCDSAVWQEKDPQLNPRCARHLAPTCADARDFNQSSMRPFWPFMTPQRFPLHEIQKRRQREPPWKVGRVNTLALT